MRCIMAWREMGRCWRAGPKQFLGRARHPEGRVSPARSILDISLGVPARVLVAAPSMAVKNWLKLVQGNTSLFSALETRPRPQIVSDDNGMAFFFLGGIFYVCLLLVNALAVLNEERFLARSTSAVLWSGL